MSAGHLMHLSPRPWLGTAYLAFMTAIFCASRVGRAYRHDRCCCRRDFCLLLIGIRYGVLYLIDPVAPGCFREAIAPGGPLTSGPDSLPLHQPHRLLILLCSSRPKRSSPWLHRRSTLRSE